MKYILGIILMQIFANIIHAQSNGAATLKLQEKYIENLNFLREKKDYILDNTTVSSNDLKNIITYKRNKYNVISEIKDNNDRERLLLEEIKDLEVFMTNYSNQNFLASYLNNNIKDVEIYSRRLDTLNKVNGLESCTKCAISRKVKILVLKVESNKIDTLNCSPLKYIKTGFQNRNLYEVELESFPCTETKELSLNGYYSKSLFEVCFLGKKYRKEFIINSGKSENDIDTLKFVLENKYLVND